MRIVIAAVGRLKQGPETELSERFRKRAAQTGRNLGLRDVEIIEIRESRADDPAKRMLEESIALANIIPQGAAVVLLDARAAMMGNSPKGRRAAGRKNASGKAAASPAAKPKKPASAKPKKAAVAAHAKPARRTKATAAE